MKQITFILTLFILLFSSCKKDKNFTKDHLDFSKDTVLFDTVFTTIGSTTKNFKIYNYNNQAINIEEIELMGGTNSPFRINVDGIASDFLTDVEIPANDSLFTFVEVTLSVNNASNPLVISDSIRFRTNGLDQFVNLDVWGQDAYFHANELTDGLWQNDKPHVLYGTVAVGFPDLDSNLNLTIPAGTQVYCHKNAQLIVYKSSINIQGNYGNEVTFQGDRLESFYDDVSGQWWGIRLIEANYSEIDYAVIKNGSVGLQVDSTQAPQTLLLTNTIIDNNDFFGLNVNAGASVDIDNCFFGDAGICSAYLFAGGEYRIDHSDFVNYWGGSRAGPALAIVNYFEVENTTYVRNVTNSHLRNSVVYGGIDKEFEMDTIQGVAFDFSLGYNYLKRDEVYTYPEYANTLFSGDPKFASVSDKDFHPTAGSVLINAGSIATVLQDIEGVSRDLSNPTLGCYEAN